MAKAAPSSPSQAKIEAELAASRARLAGNVDELTTRLKPKNLLASSVDATKAKAFAAVSDSDGEVDTAKIGKIVGGVSAGFLALGLLRRVFR